MADKLCCYYEQTDDKGDVYEKTVCTTDEECPQIEGWEQLAKWNVDECESCHGSSNNPRSTTVWWWPHALVQATPGPRRDS